ncbi:trypsin-like peptidase domain-containing protein [Kitasatospora sp. NPDC001159]
MFWERAVAVECAGRIGAGCVVAPGLVLTALHVVRPAGSGQAFGRCAVRLIGGRGRAAAEVAWHLDDVALLRFRPADLPREFAPVRWGELVCISPSRQARCVAVGLPDAAKRDGDRREPEAVEGHINAVDTDGNFYSLQADSVVPSGESASGTSPWAGMSGAGVFHEDLLIATVQQALPGRANGRLEAVPVRRLLDDRGFCDIVERASGTRPQLEPADLHTLFDSAPQPVAAASYLLAARSETVEFTGLDTELQLLRAWCHSPQAVDVAVVCGSGGVGKTRLAVELARRLADRRPQAESAPDATNFAWSAGFLDPKTAPDQTYQMLRHLIRPALIIVDYAEYHLGQVRALLEALVNHRAPAHRIRVLLVARSTHEWWLKLRARHPAMVSGTEIVLAPDNLLRQVDAQELRERARISFTRRIAALQWSGVSDDWDAEEFLDRVADHVPPHEGQTEDDPATVLSLHIESLAGVLVDKPIDGDLDPHEVLLYHEERYWDRASAVLFPQPLDPDYRKALIAVQRLAGAADQKEADAAIRAAWAAHYGDVLTAPPLTSDMVRAQRRFLSAVYPPTGHAYWGGIGPDVLTAKLVNDVEADSGGEPEGGTFLARTLSSPLLSPSQRRHCLAIVGRGFISHPALAVAAAQAVVANPNALYAEAQDLLEKLPEATRDIWRTALVDAQQRHDAIVPAQAETAVGTWSQEPGPSPAEPAGPPAPRPVVTAPLQLPGSFPLELPLPPPVSPPTGSGAASRPQAVPKPLPQDPIAAAPPRAYPTCAPKRTVPVAIRDYLGLDAHGMRRVLPAFVFLVALFFFTVLWQTR